MGGRDCCHTVTVVGGGGLLPEVGPRISGDVEWKLQVGHCKSRRVGKKRRRVMSRQCVVSIS